MVTIICFDNVILLAIALMAMLAMSYGLEKDPELDMNLDLRKEVQAKFNRMFGLLAMVTILILLGMFDYGFGRVFLIAYTLITYIVGASIMVTISITPDTKELVASFLWPILVPAYIVYKAVIFVLSPIVNSMRDVAKYIKGE